MLALCPDNMIGARDRALLAFGFAGAFRRSELCALDVADLTETPDGLRVLIRRSKGMGQEVAIPRRYRLRPVEAVQTWLAAAEISSGPVFRAAPLGGKVSPVALADDSAARIVKRYAKRAGLDAGAYSGQACAAASSRRRRRAGPRSRSYPRSAATRASTRCAAMSGASIYLRNTLERHSCKLTRAPFGPAAEALRYTLTLREPERIDCQSVRSGFC